VIRLPPQGFASQPDRAALSSGLQVQAAEGHVGLDGRRGKIDRGQEVPFGGFSVARIEGEKQPELELELRLSRIEFHGVLEERDRFRVPPLEGHGAPAQEVLAREITRIRILGLRACARPGELRIVFGAAVGIRQGVVRVGDEHEEVFELREQVGQRPGAETIG
jgi:hypothetical protein